MRLSQKKNCNSCKAGWTTSQPFKQHCDLNCKVSSKFFEGIPLEPCYKPLTNDKYMEARLLNFANA
jgi:hypothetical protein